MYSASLLYMLLVWLMLPGQSEQSCDAECVTCTGSTCTTCEDGFYVDGSNTLCTQCQNNGCTCTDTNTCTGCIPGYYYGDATLTCIKCYNNGCTCNNNMFMCNSCVLGYYKDDNRCYACNSGCSCSSSSNKCAECLDGYYLQTNTNCYKCDSKCKLCEDFSTCSKCQDGYYLHTNGTCLHECRDRYNGNTCQCKEGSYRKYIKFVYHCAYCSEGCKSCSSGTNCNTCQDGYYKMFTSGACQQCMDNCKTCGTANTCTECYPGYTYTEDTCQPDCPVNCKNNVCSVDKEMCTSGCKDRYFGLKCDQNCSTNCTSCDQNSGRCTICETGFYGDYCSETCSSGCKTTHGIAVCNIADGSCTDGCQLSTKYGPQCSKECSVQCVNQECDRVTARCLKGCQPGYHGVNCTFACNEGCINGSCHSSNGSCISGCKQGLTSGQCTAGPALSPEQSVDGGVIGGAVGGAVAGVLSIAGVVVGVCLLRRRRRTGKDEARKCGATFDNANGPSYENQTSAGGAIDENAVAAENVYDELMEVRIIAGVPYSTLSPAVEYEDVLGQPTIPSEYEDVNVLGNTFQELTKQKDSAAKESLRRKLIAMTKETEDELKTTHFELNQYPSDNE